MDLRTLHRLIGERPQSGLAIEHSHSKRILEAELALKPLVGRG
jgi:hypothetical protein